MASQSSKKTAVSNAKTLKEVHLISLVINLLALFVLFVFHRPGSKIPYFIFSIPAFLCQYTLELSGRPSYTVDKVTGYSKLVRSGEDIKGAGLFEYMFDCLYITWFVDILMIVIGRNFVWWFLAIIPGYGGYKAATFAKSFFGGKGGVAASTSPEDEAKGGKSKRQTKLEARREKGQVQVKRR